jgi:hypothetical protein
VHDHSTLLACLASRMHATHGLVPTLCAQSWLQFSKACCTRAARCYRLGIVPSNNVIGQPQGAHSVLHAH